MRECLCYSAKVSQCGFHFRSRMFVTRAESRGDTGIQRGTSLFRTTGLCQELAVLEISRDIVRMGGQQRFEMLVGSGRIAGISAFHGQAVARERVCRLSGDKIFQNLPARFLLWLGRGHAHSIFAPGRNAKFPRECQIEP